MPNNIIAKHQRGNSEFVKNLPIVDGQVVFNTETGELFTDHDGKRVPMGSVVDDINVSDKKSYSSLHSNTVYANAVKNTVSGEVIAVDDVSSLEHDIQCVLPNNNLLHLPYESMSGTDNGVEYVVNEDGSVTLNTPDVVGPDTFTFYLKRDLTGYPFPNDVVLDTSATFTDGIISIGLTKNQPETRTRFLYNAYTTGCYLSCGAGAKLDNLTVYPMINLGSKQLPYCKWLPDLSVVNVSRCGTNIYDFSTAINLEAYISYGDSVVVANPSHRTTFIRVPRNTDLTVSKKVSSRFTIAMVSAPEIGAKVFTHNNDESASALSINTGNNDWLGIWYAIKTEAEETIKTIQVQAGKTATPYEPFSKTVFKSDSDGVVSGIRALSNVITLASDIPGASINCTYNQDINIVNRKKDERIAALEDLILKLHPDTQASI